MNLEYFISKNIIKGDSHSKKITKPIIRISIIAIALGLIVMIVALSIVGGFQREIRNKVIGFGSHVQITSYDSQNTYEASPINLQQDFYPSLAEKEGIKHIQIYENICPCQTLHSSSLARTKKCLMIIYVVLTRNKNKRFTHKHKQ